MGNPLYNSSLNGEIIYLYKYYIIIPKPGCHPEVYHVTNSLGFVQGLLRVCFGFHSGFSGFLTIIGFTFKAYFGCYVRFTQVLGFIQDLGFRGLCFGKKSRHPLGQSDDIPKCIKHWLCAVKTHFPGQHPLSWPYNYVYIYRYMYMIDFPLPRSFT